MGTEVLSVTAVTQAPKIRYESRGTLSVQISLISTEDNVSCTCLQVPQICFCSELFLPDESLAVNTNTPNVCQGML